MENRNQGPLRNPFTISVVGPQQLHDISAIKNLFNDYASWLGSHGIDLTYQSYAVELSSLPGKYVEKNGGSLLLARSTSADQIPLGCVALRPLNPPEVAEMKRLWVAPQARSLALGRELVNAILATAKKLGYHEVRLDTLPFMEKAQAMYQKFGFTECEPYYDTPISGTVFLSCRISNGEEAGKSIE